MQVSWLGTQMPFSTFPKASAQAVLSVVSETGLSVTVAGPRRICTCFPLSSRSAGKHPARGEHETSTYFFFIILFPEHFCQYYSTLGVPVSFRTSRTETPRCRTVIFRIRRFLLWFSPHPEFAGFPIHPVTGRVPSAQF